MQQTLTYTVIPVADINFLLGHELIARQQRLAFFATAAVGYCPATSSVAFGVGPSFSAIGGVEPIGEHWPRHTTYRRIHSGRIAGNKLDAGDGSPDHKRLDGQTRHGNKHPNPLERRKSIGHSLEWRNQLDCKQSSSGPS